MEKDASYSIGYIINENSDEKLKQFLIKHNSEASLTIKPDGDVIFRILDEKFRKRVTPGTVAKNLQRVVGAPLVFREGDKVTTRDGRVGTVLGSFWLDDLVLYRYNDEPRKGYFVVKVEFENYYEYHIRQDLEGSRFNQL